MFWKQVVQSSTPVIATETFLSVVQGPRGTHRCWERRAWETTISVACASTRGKIGIMLAARPWQWIIGLPCTALWQSQTVKRLLKTSVWRLGPRRFVTLVRSAVCKSSYLLTYLLLRWGREDGCCTVRCTHRARLSDVRDSPFYCTSTNHIWLAAGRYCHTAVTMCLCAVAFLGGLAVLNFCGPGSRPKPLNLRQRNNQCSLKSMCWGHRLSASQ